MKPTSSSLSESRSATSPQEGLDLLDSHLWDRARRNLRLLYNGGRLAPASPQAPSTGVGALAVANTKI